MGNAKNTEYDLDKIRSEIDETDNRILELFTKRMELSERLQNIKGFTPFLLKTLKEKKKF